MFKLWICVCAITDIDKDVELSTMRPNPRSRCQCSEENLSLYAVSSTVNACGGRSSGHMDVPCHETAPVKQEVNINIYL